MLRRVHGFDLSNGNGFPLFFWGYNASFMQSEPVVGRDGLGQAIFLFNTAFGEADFLDQLDPQPTWGVHFDYQMSSTGVGGVVPSMEFYVIRNVITGTPMLSLFQRNDGLIDIRALGAVVATTSALYPFTAATWHTIEMVATFAIGPHGSVEIRTTPVGTSPSVTIATVTGIDFGITTLDELPFYMGFRWEGFGPPGIQIDNYIVYDGQPGEVTTFTGRVRVTSLYPNSEQATNWVPSGAPTCAPCVADRPDAGYIGFPDGDETYIMPPPGGADQQFSIGVSPCYGKVLGLASNAVARPVTGFQVMDFILLDGINFDLGEVVLDGPSNDSGITFGYSGYQIVLEDSPASGSVFTDAEISNSWWGIGATAGTLQLLVTQFYLEKVVDLTGLPFTCGQSSYAY